LGVDTKIREENKRVLGTSVILALMAGVIIIVSGAHGSLLQAGASFLMLALLCATAYPLSRFLFGPGIESIVFTFPIGYMLHALGLALCAWAFGFKLPVLVIYFLSSIILAVFFWRRSPTSSDPNPASLLIWLLVVAGAVALTFLHVGAETPQGYAYRAYFNADVFRNMAASGSLLRTGIPPENPYFAGYTLHYYWLFHVIPSFWMIVLPSYRVEFIFVQFALATSLAFVAALWTAVRRVSRSSWTPMFVLPLFLIGGSYEGLFVLNHLYEKKMHWTQFTTMNVDGILRWVLKLPQIDTLFRPLLYAPQHLMALTLVPLLFIAWTTSTQTRRLLLLLVILISVGFSVIVGVILVLAAGILLLKELVKDRKEVLPEILIGGVLGLVFLALYMKSFSMFSLGHGDLKFVLDANLFSRLPQFFVLQWGAILFFGLAGLFFWKEKDANYLTLLVFFLLSSCFLLFVRIQNHDPSLTRPAFDVPGLSDVSLKSGYINHVALVLFSAKFIDQVLAGPASRRKWLFGATALMVLPAAVTFAMDAYNSQDIKNAKFTSYITRDQMEMYRWMRENLDKVARVQDYVQAGGSFIESHVSETPPFANRSMYVGDTILSQIFQTPRDELAKRQQVLDDILKSEDPKQISSLAHKAEIDYFLAFPLRRNPLERRDAAPFFKVAFEHGSMTLYRVMEHEVPLYHSRGDLLMLDDQTEEATLSTYYETGFHNVEPLADGEPSRWMSQNGLVRFQSKAEFKGRLIFLAHAFARNRTLELLWNEQRVHTQRLTQSPSKVIFHVAIPPGESVLKIHCPEGPDKVGENDRRKLSIKIWGMQLRPSE